MKEYNNESFYRRTSISKIPLFLIKLGIYSKIGYLSILGFILYLIQHKENNKISFLFDIFIKKNKKYMILLQKSGFREDTLFLQKSFSKIISVNFPRDFAKGIGSCFLSKDICDNNYLSTSSRNNAGKLKLHNFYNFLFSKLPISLKPVSIITANYGYFAEQELFKAAYLNGIKGIAIHKECLKSKGIAELWRYIYSVRRDQFGGSLILFYNEKELELQKSAQAYIKEKTKVKVIGCPRLDKAHLLRKNINQPNKHKVVLFGFGNKTALPRIARKSYKDSEPSYEFLNRKDKILCWKNLLNDLCTAYYECALDNPNIEFLIKLKPNFKENKDILDFFRKKTKLTNIEIIIKGNSIEILETSTISIGFMSSTIFEGIARGIPVIIPLMGECKSENYRKYCINFENIDKDVIVVNSKGNFKKKLKQLLDKNPRINKKLSNNKKSFLKEWMGNPDGKSSRRLEKALINELI